MRVVLTIAGSDSSAGAGIQADIKAIAANGGFGACAITALTAQNTVGVRSVQLIAPQFVRAQIDAVFDDLPVAAVKTGMLGSAGVVQSVVEALHRHRPPHFVLDPVVRATSGDMLLDEPGMDALKRELLPLCTLLTPNVHEAALLAGQPVQSPQQATEAGRRLLQLGAAAVLVKGGDLRCGGPTDVLVTPEGVRVFEGQWVDSRNTHGTGCSFGAAIATLLASGLPVVEAITRAKDFVTEAIRRGPPLGAGHGPTDPFYCLRRPWVTAASEYARQLPRLHVITDEVIQQRFTHAELARLAAEGGADAVQLRDKRGWQARPLIETAEEMLQYLQPSGVCLVIDDRVDVALGCGATAVHLGREDVPPLLARQILGPAALIGGTANSLQEARRVARTPVDYLGVGPVFGTRTKANPATTLGLDGLRRIVEAVDKPVIAIGGMTVQRVTEVLDTGAWGVAAVSAVVGAEDPARATRLFRETIDGWTP